MNSKSLRRLAADHGSLYTAGLPPNYLFPPTNNSSHDPSADLTSLDVLLAGPQGTPFVSGVWRLHLDIPPTYPTAPPTATFRTRIWHPNIDESTGAVCVETLKRDWSDKLKLRDVLVTISCLLIQPNPASALNGEAGKLASEDWEGFCKRARLMTGIHAAVPREWREVVEEAQRRGEEVDEGKEMERVNGIVEERKELKKGKGKEKAKVAMEARFVDTPLRKRKSKLSQELVAEEEENIRRRGQSAEPDLSDAESDWIPGPIKTPQPFGPSRDNIFGIRVGTPNAADDTSFLEPPNGGVGHSRIIASPPKRVFEPTPNDENDTSDPFITVTSKRTTALPSFNLPSLPPPSSSASKPSTQQTPSLTSTTSTSTLPAPSTATLKFSNTNPFDTLQPPSTTSTSHPSPIWTDFSLSWHDSQILRDSGTITDGPSKQDVLKRLQEPEFEQRRRWEVKRFRACGGDLGVWNRGAWGARRGLGRL